MAFWNRWLKNENKLQLVQSDRELVINWVQNINESITSIKKELHIIPSSTVAEFKENFDDKSDDVIKKLDALPEKIIEPLKEVIILSKQEILTELIRISSHNDAHDSNDSGSAPKGAVEKPIQEVSKDLIGKQKKLLALLLDSGFLELLFCLKV